MAHPPPERRMPPREACRAGAPPKRLHHVSLLTAYHLHIIHVQHPRRALPYAMGTSGGPASLPYYPAAFLTIDSTKTTPRNASPVVYLEVQHRCWSCNSRSSPAMPIRISPRSGGYRRITPFPFSLSPRRRLEYGSAKHVSTPGPSRRRVRRTNPAPADARRWEPVRESGNATSSRRHARAATRDHRRSHDGRWRLRGLARLRSALRRAGPAM